MVMRLEEDLETLSRAIMKEAEADAQQIKEEALAKAEDIRQRAQEQAAKEREAILKQAQQEAERLKGQVVASAQLRARTLQLEHREKLLDRVFDAARQRVASLQKRSDYNRIAVQLLREALTQLNATSAVVRADAATERFLKSGALKDLNAEIKFGTALDEGTGLVVDASDGHLHFNNTLETRLQRLQSSLRSSVYHVLMGEKL